MSDVEGQEGMQETFDFGPLTLLEFHKAIKQT